MILERALRVVACRVFAALAGVRARTDTVHRDRERLVRLRRQRAERHARAVEAPHDVLDRLDLVERHGRPGRAQRHQVAQRRNRPVVDQRRILLVALVAAGLHRRLQGRDDIGIEAVVLAAVHVLQQAALLDRLAWIPGAGRKLFLVGQQVGKVRTLDTRWRATETALHDFLVQADDFEQLRAAIARDRRDTHLRHDLEQTLANAAPVAAAELLLLADIAALRDVVQ